jgi:hypothetical protein
MWGGRRENKESRGDRESKHKKNKQKGQQKMEEKRKTEGKRRGENWRTRSLESKNNRKQRKREEVNFNLSYLASIFFAASRSCRLSQEQKFLFLNKAFG